MKIFDHLFNFALIIAFAVACKSTPPTGEGLEMSEIHEVIMENTPEIRACYVEGLKRKTDMAGKVTVDFKINNQGAVTIAQVKKSTLGDTEVETCITNRMMNWIFPKPRGENNVKVTYPYNFLPKKP